MAGLFCSGCAISLLGGPKFDPSLDWNMITTPHFRVYFHQGEDEWAQKAARIAEEVHSRLVPKLGWEPAEPTHLVLIDDQDATSGSATPFPYDSIYISLTPPPENPVPFLVGFDDWLRDVITHEYTHILQLDMNTGFPALMRTIFGRQPIPFLILNSAIPNILQPDWLIEGLATYEETATGVSDRRDNAYADMLLRMAILEDRFPTLDQAGGLDSWPGHQIEYLFGARFLDYIARRFGESALKDLSLEYSDNVIPFFVGTTGRQILGQSYESLWAYWKRELNDQYGRQQERLKSTGLTPSDPITHRGDYNLGPRMSPDGRQIVYTGINPHGYPALRMVNPASGQDDFLVRRNMGFTASWSPDGKRLAFSQLEIYQNYSEYSDLYLYDLSTATLERLTHGARLRDPDFHPDGTRLIAVENRLGQNRLVVYHLDTGRQETLNGLESDVVLTHPRWSPDGKSIAVSVWKNGLQGIGLVDLGNKKVSMILMDRFQDLTPVWSPDGKVLLFSSDRTGVYNLFAYEVETAELFQVTNVLGGALTPDVTPDGREIIFSYYSSRGFDLHRMPWSPASWRKVEQIQEGPVPASATQETIAPLKTDSYSPWPTLRPHFWTPIFGSDETGSQIGAATGGMDILGKHKFDATALYGTSTHRAAGSLQYVNDSFYPSFHIGISDLAVKDSDLFKNAATNNDYWERQQHLDMDMTLSRLFFQTQQSVLFGYRAEWFSGLSDIPIGFVSPDEGTLSGLRLAWQLNTTKEYGFSISREDGRRLLASYERFDRRLGSDFDQNRYIASWHEYQGFFWQHHVLAARLTGAVATGDRLIQRAFEVGGLSVTEEFMDPDQSEFFLRGYPSRLLRGPKAAVGSLEYRLPLQNIEHGISTWPFFFQRTHADFFFDIGNAWDKDTTLSDFRRGVGIEIKMDMILGHLLPLRLRLGLAKGLDAGGERQTYFTIGNSF
jgi:Tol biopolymer transport system component